LGLKRLFFRISNKKRKRKKRYDEIWPLLSGMTLQNPAFFGLEASKAVLCNKDLRMEIIPPTI
jgi:hypothetical protein